MAGKIVRNAYVPLDERPEFIELRDSLPTDPAALGQLLLDGRAAFNDAVLAGHVDALPEISMRFQAALHRMHGEMRGSGAADSAPRLFLAPHEPALGQVPKWGEAGEFLLEVEGVRIRVQLDFCTMDWAQTCALHVVDIDKPFVSSSGFRSLYVVPSACAGLTVDQAVRREVLAILDGKPKAKRLEAITEDDRVRRRKEGQPQWLLDALAGVTRDGQLTLFGEQVAKKAPMSAAERQRRHREKLKREREEGRRCDLSLRAQDVALVRAALKACGGRADAVELLGRLPEVAVDEPDLQGAGLAAGAEAAPVLEGELGYRLSEQDVAWLLVCISSHLTIRPDLGGSDLRELVERLEHGTRFAGYSAQLGQEQGVLSILKRLKDEAGRWQRAYQELVDQQRNNAEKAEAIAAQRREAEQAHLRRRVAALEQEVAGLQRENAQVVEERSRAFAAHEALLGQLQVHGGRP